MTATRPPGPMAMSPNSPLVPLLELGRIPVMLPAPTTPSPVTGARQQLLPPPWLTDSHTAPWPAVMVGWSVPLVHGVATVLKEAPPLVLMPIWVPMLGLVR